MMSKNSGQSIQSKTCASIYYKEAHLKTFTPKPPLAQQPRHRHLEIASTEQYPYGLDGILEITESLSVKDNLHLSFINDLKPTLRRQKDLQVERCHKSIALFQAKPSYETCEQLQNLHVSHVQNMTTLLIETHSTWFFPQDFGLLKNLFLSRCPRLESIFPDNLILPSLETLTITHCDRLQTVFYNSISRSIPTTAEKPLRGLRSIRFQEVPQLQHFYEEQNRIGRLQIPEWKMLYFRGCWSLRQLPLLTGTRDQKVCVDGEIKQCNKIKAQMEAEQLSHYEFKSPPPIASLKDGVKNRFFLK